MASPQWTRRRRHHQPSFSWLAASLALLPLLSSARAAATGSSESSTLPRFSLKGRGSSGGTKPPATSSPFQQQEQGQPQDKSPPSGHGKWDLRAFHAFVKARAGSGDGTAPSLAREAYWVLSGQLSNPFTGDVIAVVRGIEVVRLAGSVHLPAAAAAAAASRSGGYSAGGGLPPSPIQALPGAKKALKIYSEGKISKSSSSSDGTVTASQPPQPPQPQPQPQWAALATVLSAKAFRYFHPLTGQPLRTFRPAPRAKPRAVPEGIASVQAVTYALSRKGQLHIVAESLSGGLLAVKDEGTGPTRPAAPSWLPRLPSFLGGGGGTPRKFELSLLMWPGSKKGAELSDIGGTGSGSGNGGGIAWGSLIQLGASTSQPPCRELYAYSTEGSGSGRGPGGRRPRMRYLRYGECPHWCGAGRVCHLALEGVRYDRLQDVPKADRKLFNLGGGAGEGSSSPAAGAVDGGGRMAPPALPETAQDFADEAERQRHARRKRFYFF